MNLLTKWERKYEPLYIIKELTEALTELERLIDAKMEELQIGIDTIRSHVKTGKHSTSLTQLGLLKQEERGYSVTDLGYDILEFLKRDPDFAPYFIDAPTTNESEDKS